MNFKLNKAQNNLRLQKLKKVYLEINKIVLLAIKIVHLVIKIVFIVIRKKKVYLNKVFKKYK